MKNIYSYLHATTTLRKRRELDYSPSSQNINSGKMEKIQELFNMIFKEKRKNEVYNIANMLLNYLYLFTHCGRLSTLRVRALLCIQNMASMLDLSEIGGSELMYTTWVDLGNLVFQNACKGK